MLQKSINAEAVQCRSFSHHQQGRIDFNTVNPSLPTLIISFLHVLPLRSNRSNRLMINVASGKVTLWSHQSCSMKYYECCSMKCCSMSVALWRKRPKSEKGDISALRVVIWEPWLQNTKCYKWIRLFLIWLLEYGNGYIVNWRKRGCCWVHKRSDCRPRTMWAPRMLEIICCCTLCNFLAQPRGLNTEMEKAWRIAQMNILAQK